MGAVYCAEHPEIGRLVAIKVLHPESQRLPDIAVRFLGEAQTASKISHKHVIEILDFGKMETGEPYLAMEWLKGESLAERLSKERRFPFPRVRHVLEGVGNALAAAHAHGVVHRDLKPDNVYLVDRDGDPDFVKVLDFGIAKVMRKDPEGHRTKSGAVLGTPAYMSPEQIRGMSDLDHRSDIYSLGVMAYEMVTGRLPFVREGWGDLVLAHVNEAPRPPIELEPTLPPAANRLILRALEKVPEERFQSVDDLLTELTGKRPEPAQPRVSHDPPSGPSQPTMARRTTLRGASGQIVPGVGPKARRRSRLALMVVPVVALVGAMELFRGRGHELHEPPAPRLTASSPTAAAPAPSSPSAPGAAAIPPPVPIQGLSLDLKLEHPPGITTPKRRPRVGKGRAVTAGVAGTDAPVRSAGPIATPPAPRSPGSRSDEDELPDLPPNLEPDSTSPPPGKPKAHGSGRPRNGPDN